MKTFLTLVLIFSGVIHYYEYTHDKEQQIIIDGKDWKCFCEKARMDSICDARVNKILSE